MTDEYELAKEIVNGFWDYKHKDYDTIAGLVKSSIVELGLSRHAPKAEPVMMDERECAERASKFIKDVAWEDPDGSLAEILSAIVWNTARDAERAAAAKCAEIVNSENELDGPMPEGLQEFSREDIGKAAVRCTKRNIINNIRTAFGLSDETKPPSFIDVVLDAYDGGEGMSATGDDARAELAALRAKAASIDEVTESLIREAVIYSDYGCGCCEMDFAPFGNAVAAYVKTHGFPKGADEHPEAKP